MFNVVIFVFLCIVSAVSFREVQPSDTPQICLPFKAYIIWDPGNEKDTFDVQVHYVLQIIDSTPEGTSIRLDTVDEKFRNVLDITKVNDQEEKWIDSITNVTHRLSEYKIIPYKSIKEVISNSFQKNMKAAELIFFVVNDKSEIDDEERALMELKRRKVFVVFHGTNSPPSKFWTNVATDKHHVLKPNDNIDQNADAFINLLCRDSTLYCSTDNYWNGTGCFRCSFICSKMPSEYCQTECPYFNQFKPDVEISDELPDSCVCICNNTTTVVLGILSFILQCIVGIGLIVCCKYTRTMSQKKQSDTTQDYLLAKANSSRETAQNGGGPGERGQNNLYWVQMGLSGQEGSAEVYSYLRAGYSHMHLITVQAEKNVHFLLKSVCRPMKDWFQHILNPGDQPLIRSSYYSR